MPENNADVQSKQLIEEIRERIEALKQRGIHEPVLKSLLQVEPASLSRLLITKEYRIILPDYGKMEIKMYPLSKAVFLLFLNHPQGILFKDLPKYKNELLEIYKKISGRNDIAGMMKSIDAIVNPRLNSIHEKCSRIREAFTGKFDEAIARHYYITGERATPKKITLNRDLVLIEENI